MPLNTQEPWLLLLLWRSQAEVRLVQQREFKMRFVLLFETKHLTEHNTEFAEVVQDWPWVWATHCYSLSLQFTAIHQNNNLSIVLGVLRKILSNFDFLPEYIFLHRHSNDLTWRYCSLNWRRTGVWLPGQVEGLSVFLNVLFFSSTDFLQVLWVFFPKVQKHACLGRFKALKCPKMWIWNFFHFVRPLRH